MWGDDMSKFQIPNLPPTTNKTIRFPNNIIERVENAIMSSNCTFSAFVVASVRMALEDLEQEKDRAAQNKSRTHVQN